MMEKIGEAGCSTADHLHVHHVPEELVIEILLRLPVESLLRCKAVCKNWYILITRSDFINNHFNHYHRNNNHSRLFVYHSNPRPTLITPGFAASLSRIHHDLDYLRISLKLPAYIVGPVNGLFLLCHNRNRQLHDYPLALLNPATRELRPLFLPDGNQNPKLRSGFHTFGFGFDPSTNDYKVVVFWNLFDCTNPREVVLKLKIAIYSLANDSWKHLEPYQQTMCNSPTASSSITYFKGACHWLSHDHDCLLSFAKCLLSFDLGSEVMREINGPQDVSTGACLFVYKNEALAIFHRQSFCLFDLIVMKEEGRWIKYFTMDLSDSHRYLRVVDQPFGICKNNRLFVAAHIIRQKNEKGDKLVLYDPVTHEIEEVRVPCLLKYANDHDVFSYNESLLSVKGGGNKSSSIRSSPKFSAVVLKDVWRCGCDEAASSLGRGPEDRRPKRRTRLPSWMKDFHVDEQRKESARAKQSKGIR